MTAEQCLSILRQGAGAWNSWREQHPDTPIDLSGVTSPAVSLEGINLSHATLRKTDFSFLSLKRANLAFADLEGAVFLFSNLEQADLRGSVLRKASFEDANLRNATLAHSDLRDTLLANADCTEADFSNAVFKGTNLSGTNLENAKVTSVSYERKILFRLIRDAGFRPGEFWKRRLDFVLDTTIRCRGIHAASCYGSRRFIEFLRHQDYLEEIFSAKRGAVIIYLWWIFADCGRSFGRWAGWTLIFIMLFAFVFSLLGPDHFSTINLPFGVPSMLFYSVVTFSTLGFGVIAPKTGVSAFLTAVEVIVGYVMFGGLISIFSSKITRRGG